MASTYSTDLKLELIGTGDQSGTWGNTTNTNLGTLLEQAIVGYVTQAVTDGAATVLTIPNGASSNGRNYVIELTGALTANRTVEVPAVDKPYIFFNNTTGGFSVTVKVSGQTGVTIANGKKAIVYTNSTDVIEVVNAPVSEAGTQTLTNKTLTAPVISTISNTGTLTLPTSTDTLVGRATTDTLSNKTLVAPVALASSTTTQDGLILTGRAGGTSSYRVTIAPTTLSASRSVTMPDAAGVVVLDTATQTLTNKTLTSPTVNTATISGGTIDNAAIGGTTPAAGTFTSLSDSGNLTFTGTGNRITGDFSNATLANRVMFQSSTTNGNTGVFFVPNGTATTSNLQVSNAADPTNSSVGIFGVSGSTDVRIQSATQGSGTNLPMTFYTGGSERMRVDTSGNVGIATSSAAFATGYAGLQLNSSTKTELRLTNSSIGTAATDGFAFYVNTVGDAYVWNNENATLQFATNNTERMRITADGNINIATVGARITGDFSNTTHANRVSFQTSTTNGATTPFLIPNGTSTNAGIVVANASDPTNSSYGQLRVTSTTVDIISSVLGTGTQLPLVFGVAGSERIRVTTAGDVGIGTSSPGTKFDAYQSTGTTTIQSRNGDASGYSTFRLKNDGASGRSYDIGLAGNSVSGGNALYFYDNTANAERMRIDSSGNVGIGTSAPGKKVDIYNSGTTTTDMVIRNGTVSLLSFVDSGAGYIGTSTSHPVLFTTGGSERARIDTSGNTSVGTSTTSWRFTSVGGAIQLSGGTTSQEGVRIQRASGVCSFTGINNDNNAYNALSFATGASEAMRIDTSGNVGIGTASIVGVTGTKLDVRGSITAGDSSAGRVSLEQGISTNSGYVAFWNTDLSTRQGYVGYATLAGGGVMTISADTNNALNFSTNGTERMRIKTDGEVLIAGTTDQGAYNLQVNGTGVWGAGAYTNGSDARIKEDVSSLTSGIDVVSKLRPVQFRYKADWSKDTSLQPGFIAQELQAALADQPYVNGVVQQGPEYMSVAYQTLIPVLTKAIQEQQAQIEELKARVAALENA